MLNEYSAYYLIRKISEELVHGLSGLQFASALGERCEKFLEVLLKSLLLDFQLRLVFSKRGMLLYSFLKLL